ncbi:MAG TPA: hypothetical protein VGM82_11065 [Gemmatimonadaceae bacterium]|jgi:hypothetical protein
MTSPRTRRLVPLGIMRDTNVRNPGHAHDWASVAVVRKNAVTTRLKPDNPTTL